MKKWLVGILTVFSGMHAFATHLVGGEMSYRCLGNNQYEITLKMYRDCGPSNTNGTGFDNTAVLGVYNSAGQLVQTLSPALPNSPGPQQVPVIINNPCFIAPPSICVEEAVYTAYTVLPPDSGGYDIVYQRCCRNPTIVNLVQPDDLGATYSVHVPDSTMTTCNSTPRFDHFPPLVICINDDVTFDHSATDPDGDSLVYSLCTPLNGGSPSDPAPNPPTPPPYSGITWNTGYSAANPIIANPSFSIDAQSGLLTGTAQQAGQYVVGVCVEEYRDGVLLSTKHRDFQFNVVQCQVLSEAIISDQTLFCDGRTVNFSHNSVNASGFYWDFGDPNSTSDTSSAASPTYTYQDTGVYTVMLIANPGRFCADTAYETFEVYPKLYPEFDPPASQCLSGNSYRFFAGGLYGDDAVFNWDFGSSAQPQSSSSENPSGIHYTAEGTYPVKLTVSENGCVRTYTDTIMVIPEPRADFSTPADTGCAPYTVSFENSSSAWTKMSYYWDFGDGNTSTEEHPEHTYGQPGLYDVGLRVITTSGCIDTSEVFFPGLILVNPKPTAAFHAEPLITSMYDPEITFFDGSSGALNCEWLLGDSASLKSCFSSFTHSFTDTGNVKVVQKVINEFGCTDTAQQYVFIEPEYTFFAPNAFTPDDDGLNEQFLPEVYAVSKYDLYIFDRWGHQLFHTSDPEQGWNGKKDNRGDLLPTGTYVYMVKIIDHNGVPHTYRGAFHLLK